MGIDAEASDGDVALGPPVGPEMEVIHCLTVGRLWTTMLVSSTGIDSWTSRLVGHQLTRTLRQALIALGEAQYPSSRAAIRAESPLVNSHRRRVFRSRSGWWHSDDPLLMRLRTDERRGALVLSESRMMG